MRPTKYPVQSALGERNGSESFIIQSTLGIEWSNIPLELEKILQGLAVEDLLDFSLGNNGRFYIKYNADGEEKQKLSKGLWTEIRQRHQDTIDRLILGDSDDHWGVMAETLRAGKVLKDQPFGKASTSFQDHLRELMERFSDYSDVTFAALGGSGHWALNVGGSLRYCGPLSFNKAIREAKDSGKDIVNVAFSRLSDQQWLIIAADGSIEHNLTGSTAQAVRKHVQSRNSLSPIPLAIMARQTTPSSPAHVGMPTSAASSIATMSSPPKAVAQPSTLRVPPTSQVSSPTPLAHQPRSAPTRPSPRATAPRPLPRLPTVPKTEGSNLQGQTHTRESEIDRAIDVLLITTTAREGHPSSRTTDSRVLDKKLAGLDVLLRDLLDGIARRKIALKRQHNSLLPIHHLPVELLARIFGISIGKEMDKSWVLDPPAPSRFWGDKWWGETQEIPARRLLNLSSVARHWSDVLRGTPQLWTTVEMEGKCFIPAGILQAEVGTSEMRSRGTILALSRSQELPLHVKCVYNSHFPPPQLAEFIRIIGYHSYRWRSLQLQGDFEIIDTLLRQHPTPLIEHLDIWAVGANGEALEDYYVTSQLRTLRVGGLLLSWPSQPRLLQLTSVYLRDIGAWELTENTSTGELVTFLASCPALEDLTLRDIGSDRDDPTTMSPRRSAPIVTLPNLTSLSFILVQESLVLDILQAIHSDNITTFTLVSPFNSYLGGHFLVQALQGTPTHGSILEPLRQKSLAGLHLEVITNDVYISSNEDIISNKREGNSEGIYINTRYLPWKHAMSQLVGIVGHPTKLHIGPRPGRGEFHLSLEEYQTVLRTEWVSDVTHMYLRDDIDVVSVLEVLSFPKGDRAEPTSWACPSLREVHLSPKELGQALGYRLTRLISALLDKRDILVYDTEGILYHNGLKSFMGVDMAVPDRRYRACNN